MIHTQEFEKHRELRRAIHDYINEYNTYRPHSSIADHCSDEV
ncbi:IS3 family transposase [Paenibacillus antibioticophila]